MSLNKLESIKLFYFQIARKMLNAAKRRLNFDQPMTSSHTDADDRTGSQASNGNTPVSSTSLLSCTAKTARSENPTKRDDTTRYTGNSRQNTPRAARKTSRNKIRHVCRKCAGDGKKKTKKSSSQTDEEAKSRSPRQENCP